jgi:hypothetical protein
VLVEQVLQRAHGALDAGADVVVVFVAGQELRAADPQLLLQRVGVVATKVDLPVADHREFPGHQRTSPSVM